MSVQSEINRIESEVSSQTSLISQITTAMEEKTEAWDMSGTAETGTPLEQNTAILQAILDAVNALPEEGTGVLNLSNETGVTSTYDGSEDVTINYASADHYHPVLKSDQYGDALPVPGTAGRIFYKTLDSTDDSFVVTVLKSVYPVGSIYISAASTSPSTLFGFGTWEQIQDTFLLAAGSTYAAGSTGGEATHTLTVSEMPSHKHTITGDGTYFTASGAGYINKSGTAYANLPGLNMGAAYTSQGYVSFDTTGGGTAHNNMPPYLSVYVWKRTA